MGHTDEMRRSMSLGTHSLGAQLLALQVVIVLVTVASAGVLAVRLQQDQIRDTYQARVLAVAQSVARLPSVVEAYDDPDPAATLQPLAELIREASDATFVVLTDAEGIRYSHPNAERIGEMVSTDPSETLSGATFVGTETGTLGASLRAKVPVRDAQGDIIGAASVGILESELAADLQDDVPELVAWLVGAAVVGSVAAAAVTRLVRRRIFGLEPHQIARLLETRDAMLHGIREGVVAVDDQGRLALVNDEAIRLLGLHDDPTGRAASEVLDTGGLLTLAQQQDDVADRLVLAGERLLVANRTTASVDGRRVGAVLTLRDRTELYEALRELDGQRSITEALRAQAHEFSNQMHVLTGLLELGRQDEAVRYISRAGGGGAILGGSALATVKEPAVAALLVAKSAMARERGVTLRLDPASQIGLGDGTDIVTILGNLVDNALDAADTGGSVDVAVSSDSGGVTIRVADDGPGLPRSQHSRVFEPGVSTKQHRGGPHGRGIGLALVARVVTRRAGEVQVSDRDGGGAVFEVWLPHPPPPAERSTTTAGVAR